MRRAKGMNAGKASALADLAKRKETGASRALDFEAEEQAPIYDEVDEATYAEIAALKRKDARDFLVRDGPQGGGGGGDDEPDEYGDMENEFAYEDELSMIQHDAEGRKRKRGPGGGAPRRRGPTQLAKPVRKVAPAFFNAAERAAVAPSGAAAADEIAPVFDLGQLDKDFEDQLKNRRASRKKIKRSSNAPEGLFDAIPKRNAKLESQPAGGASFDLPDNNDEPSLYDAPPPSLTPNQVDTATPSQTPSTTPAKKAPEPKISVEDLDDDALVAAVDEALANSAGKPPQKKLNTKISDYTPNTTPAKSASQPRVRNPSSTPRQTPNSTPTPKIGSQRQTVAPNAPLARFPNGDILLYWTDAQDVRINGGGEALYLFGKAAVGTLDSGVYASVCVQVQGLERKLYILPRITSKDGKNVKIIPDVYGEVKDRLLGKNNERSMRLGGTASVPGNLPINMQAKIVSRASPFCDSDAPREPTDYLKVKIPYNKACKLSTDSTGNTFARVYGTKTGAAQEFALKKGLKGPGWLRICNFAPMRLRATHARHSFVVESPESVTLAMDFINRPPPALSMLSLHMKSVISSKSGAHEIVMIAGVYAKEVPLVGAFDAASLLPGSRNTNGAENKEFVLVRAPDGVDVPFGFRDRAASAVAGGAVEVLPNELALLNNFLTKILKLDPDVIVAHDLMGFALDVLLARFHARKSRNWTCLGRLTAQARNLSLAYAVKNGTSSSWFKEDAVAGRLAVDTLAAAKEFNMGEKDYSLTALSHNVLAPAINVPNDRVRASVPLNQPTDVTRVPAVFENANTLCALVSECAREARTSAMLAAHLNLLPLTRQLTCISGNLWSRTLRGARAERIEYLLAHELRLIGRKKAGNAGNAGNIATKLLLPDKLTKSERVKLDEMKNGPKEPVDKKKGRRKPQYSGGLVLEPKKGLYDKYILQLDFNSLYPSIIQEYNICFTTMNLDSDALVPPGRAVLEGVLPRVLRRLIQQRREVKRQLKDERSRAKEETLHAQQLETRQLAIKLTANSLYGCLGFEGSRFFARPLAELVTLQGRETLQKTVELSRDEFNAEVVYGDTDSIFVNTGLDDISAVRRMGVELKREVNKRYHTLEIEIDAIYRKMLLLKKKKYAALKVVDPSRPNITVREVKGLDLVRHDWCDLSHDASEHFLTQIFRSASTNVDEAVGNVLAFLSELRSKVESNEVALGKYVITKALTKRAEDYPDAKNLPHVQVALRIQNNLKRRVQVGDYIKYVVCLPVDSKVGGATGGVAERAYHPDEVVESKGNLKIDTKYYLEHQILPPVLRLADPIESVEQARIAVSLGIDGRRYERTSYEREGDSLALGLVEKEADKYRDCAPLQVKCAGCGARAPFAGLSFAPKAKAVRSSGLECTACGKRLNLAAIHNAVAMHVREWCKMYYCEPLRVSGAELGRREVRTRNVALGGVVADRVFDEAWLYTQLRFLHFLMDLDARWKRAANAAKIDPGKLEMPVSLIDQRIYKALRERVDRAFDRNAFRFVDFADFLAPLGIA